MFFKKKKKEEEVKAPPPRILTAEGWKRMMIKKLGEPSKKKD